MKKANFSKTLSIVLALLMLMGTFLTMPAFAAVDAPPYISSIKVCTPGTSDELVSVNANTAFDLIIGIEDTQRSVDATKNAPIVRLDTTAFSIGAVSDIVIENPTNTSSYTVKFKNVKYLGGGTPKFDFSISYTGSTVPMVSLSTTLNMCKEPVAPTPPPVAPTPAPAKAPTLAPKAVSASSTQVNPNVPFSVTANTTNTSSDQVIENVTATVTMDTQLKLSSGSNTIYIGNLAAGASTKATFNLSAANTAEPGSYKATITFSGTWNGEPITCAQEIAVSVVQPERFEISRTEFTDTVFIGEETPLTVYYVNKGKGIIYNLSAEIKGENISNPGQQQFVGNVAAGTENSLEFYINAEQVGALNGTVTLTYEDADGNIKTLEKEFAASVEENQFDNGGGGMFPGGDMGVEEIPIEPQQGMPIWAWILIAVGVAGVVAVVVVIIVKKRKQKKLAKELEEDDEDI